MQLTATLILSLLAHQVAGHAAIIKAVGDAGGSGMAIGVDTATPRDGTRRDPFQQDSTRFKGDAADTVGETVGGGTNNLEAGTTAIMGETGDALPQVTQGGAIKMVTLPVLTAKQPQHLLATSRTKEELRTDVYNVERSSTKSTPTGPVLTPVL